MNKTKNTTTQPLAPLRLKARAPCFRPGRMPGPLVIPDRCAAKEEDDLVLQDLEEADYIYDDLSSGDEDDNFFFTAPIAAKSINKNTKVPKLPPISPTSTASTYSLFSKNLK
jgi:hypothetical protein